MFKIIHTVITSGNHKKKVIFNEFNITFSVCPNSVFVCLTTPLTGTTAMCVLAPVRAR